MRESDIQPKIIEHLEKWGWLVVKIIQSTKNGWPDLQAFRNGITVFIEVKKPGKEPDDLQLYRHKKLHEQGFEVITADKIADIKHLK